MSPLKEGQNPLTRISQGSFKVIVRSVSDEVISEWFLVLGSWFMVLGLGGAEGGDPLEPCEILD